MSAHSEKRDCTNCYYGLWWGYECRFGPSKPVEPITKYSHILHGDCRWPLFNKKIYESLPPQYQRAAYYYGIDSNPTENCPAWKKEPAPGYAPQWGEKYDDWLLRRQKETEARLKEDAEFIKTFRENIEKIKAEVKL